MNASQISIEQLAKICEDEDDQILQNQQRIQSGDLIIPYDVEFHPEVLEQIEVKPIEKANTIKNQIEAIQLEIGVGFHERGFIQSFLGTSEQQQKMYQKYVKIHQIQKVMLQQNKDILQLQLQLNVDIQSELKVQFVKELMAFRQLIFEYIKNIILLREIIQMPIDANFSFRNELNKIAERVSLPLVQYMAKLSNHPIQDPKIINNILISNQEKLMFLFGKKFKNHYSDFAEQLWVYMDVFMKQIESEYLSPDFSSVDLNSIIQQVIIENHIVDSYQDFVRHIQRQNIFHCIIPVSQKMQLFKFDEKVQIEPYIQESIEEVQVKVEDLEKKPTDVPLQTKKPLTQKQKFLQKRFEKMQLKKQMEDLNINMKTLTVQKTVKSLQHKQIQKIFYQPVNYESFQHLLDNEKFVQLQIEKQREKEAKLDHLMELKAAHKLIRHQRRKWRELHGGVQKTTVQTDIKVEFDKFDALKKLENEQLENRILLAQQKYRKNELELEAERLNNEFARLSGQLKRQRESVQLKEQEAQEKISQKVKQLQTEIGKEEHFELFGTYFKGNIRTELARGIFKEILEESFTFQAGPRQFGKSLFNECFEKSFCDFQNKKQSELKRKVKEVQMQKIKDPLIDQMRLDIELMQRQIELQKKEIERQKQRKAERDLEAQRKIEKQKQIEENRQKMKQTLQNELDQQIKTLFQQQKQFEQRVGELFHNADPEEAKRIERFKHQLTMQKIELNEQIMGNKQIGVKKKQEETENQENQAKKIKILQNEVEEVYFVSQRPKSAVKKQKLLIQKYIDEALEEEAIEEELERQKTLRQYQQKLEYEAYKKSKKVNKMMLKTQGWEDEVD